MEDDETEYGDDPIVISDGQLLPYDLSEVHTAARAADQEYQWAARTILWYAGDRVNGWEPGSFSTLLVQAMMHADRTNRRLLSVPYPQLMICVRYYKDDPNGMAKLLRIATGKP